MPISNISDAIAAIGALGIAAFALVDSSKIAKGGGVSGSGFHFIEGGVKQYLPKTRRSESSSKTGALEVILDLLHGNWINGMPLADQKAIAKSLIKLHLTADTAADFAKAANVDENKLREVARCMATGSTLSSDLSNTLGRFDLSLTATLDSSYQRADQRYRNASRTWAMGAAIVLAFVGGWGLSNFTAEYFLTGEWAKALLCGLLATPLAPVSKDLTSALAAAVKASQSLSFRK